MPKSDLQTAGEALKVQDEIATLTSGTSMRPMLRQHRDVVIIKRPDRELKKGDVVLYAGKNDKFVLHRIMRFKGDELIIRGDNNYFTERGIKKSDIIGILKEFYRDGKYVSCSDSFKYKIYTFYICHSYWVRFVWMRTGRRVINKIKYEFNKLKK